MKRGKPLKRTPFLRKEGPTVRPAREWIGEYRPERPRAVMARCDAPARAIPKDAPVRSEAYRRLVAALPCAHCRITGYSQAAHPPPTAKGRKEDDRTTFPLCCTRPGVTGCHADFDQMRLFPRPAMRYEADRWGRQTRAAIRNAGQWPEKLPPWKEDDRV